MEQPIPIHVISQATLAKVIEYCKYHNEIDRNNQFEKLKDQVWNSIKIFFMDSGSQTIPLPVDVVMIIACMIKKMADRNMPPQPSGKITILETNDGTQFCVEKEVADMSVTIKNMMCDF